ncbi:TIAL1, partial [Cordylochernes scorpioides]
MDAVNMFNARIPSQCQSQDFPPRSHDVSADNMPTKPFFTPQEKGRKDHPMWCVQDAENAITTMNGQWLGSRAIRTNWATRKPSTNRSQTDSNCKPLTFDEVYNQSSPNNCTVYCGGLAQGLSEELMQKTFTQFGIIQEIRVFKDKGYAFVRFATKEAATHAIVATHNHEINGQLVKCSWGKEASDPNNQQQQSLAAQYTYPYQQLGYWYPQGYPQLQGQFMQYPYGLPYGSQGF